jgi:hypothetical protein
MNGKKILAIVCLLACFLAGSAVSISAQTLLPDAFAGWTASATGSQAPASQAEQFAGDKAPILREYGLASAERRDYTQTKNSATVTLYRMVDPSAAFGAFTYLREPEMVAVGSALTTPYSAASRQRVVFVVGNLVLDVSSPITRPEDIDLKALADGLKPHVDRRPFPEIAQFLPAPGLVKGSERYVLGPRALAEVFPSGSAASKDWVGFGDSAEAIVARYHLEGQAKGQDAILLIALYPTQQVAADSYNSLGKWFALNAEADQANGHPIVFGTRSGPLVAVLSGVNARATAVPFLSQIRYGSQVTWNEPSQSYSDPGIGTMVVGAIMGTGAIMVLAIAAGIGFGGFRLLVKFFLPGKVFDRKDQLEILQLGLTSKPIKAEDFYSLNSSRPS